MSISVTLLKGVLYGILMVELVLHKNAHTVSIILHSVLAEIIITQTCQVISILH